ncbi:MAG: hypothetical protein ACJAZR_000640 [Sediminicola sp.]|jgi:hypothetical protein
MTTQILVPRQYYLNNCNSTLYIQYYNTSVFLSYRLPIKKCLLSYSKQVIKGVKQSIGYDFINKKMGLFFGYLRNSKKN